jgi:hypothetical protein
MASSGGQKVIPGGRRPPGITLSRGTKNTKNEKNEKSTKKTCKKSDPWIQNRYFLVKIVLIWVKILTPGSKSSQIWVQIRQISLTFLFFVVDVRCSMSMFDVFSFEIGASFIHQLCYVCQPDNSNSHDLSRRRHSRDHFRYVSASFCTGIHDLGNEIHLIRRMESANWRIDVAENN